MLAVSVRATKTNVACDQMRTSQQGLPDSQNKKQCSRQVQCEVPCSVGNVINSSLFINSSLSSLSSTSHVVFLSSTGGGSGCRGGSACGGGQGTFWSSCHILHCHMVLRPKGTSYNKAWTRAPEPVLQQRCLGRCDPICFCR